MIPPKDKAFLDIKLVQEQLSIDDTYKQFKQWLLENDIVKEVD